MWFPSSPLKAIRAKAPKAKVEYNDGADPAAAAALAKASEVAIVFVNQPTSEGRDLPTPDAARQAGRPGERGGRGQPAHHRGARNRRCGGHAVDRQRERAHRDLVSRHQAAPRRWPTFCSATSTPAAKLPVTLRQERRRSAASRDLRHALCRRRRRSARRRGAGEAAGRDFDIDYTEGLKVGYKWFDAENKEPLFPFGYGLSYTTYAYSGLKAGVDSVIVHGAQHRQARRRGDRPGLRRTAGRRAGTAQAAGGVGEGRAWRRANRRPSR